MGVVQLQMGHDYFFISDLEGIELVMLDLLFKLLHH